MANVLNFRLTVEDLLGPRVAAALQRVQELGRQVERPHKLNVDASQAQGALSGIMGLVGKLGLAAAFAAGGKAIVGMGVGMEQTRVQFETFTGSAEKGNAVIAQLQKFANLTPFDDEQVISAGRQLLAFGEDAQSLNPILTKLGNISSATGKDFGELVSIYGKNKLSGIIQGEDLNQLTEAGIPVMDSLARQLHVTTDQVKKMGADGKISFKMLETAFDELGGAGGKWGSLMDKQSQTVAGRWSSLVGFAQNLGGRIGEALLPAIGRVVDGGNAVLQFIQQNTAKLQQMFDPIRQAVQPVIDVLQRIGFELFGDAEAGDVLATAFNVVANAIRLAAPVIKIVATLLGKVLGTVWDLIKGIAKFIQTHEWIQKYYAAIWGGAVAAFKGIAEAAGKFLGGVGHLLQGILTMDWQVLKQGFAETMSGLASTGPKLGVDVAKGVVEGWKDGIKPVKLFGTDGAASGGSDAATAFAQGKPGGQKAGAMTSDASKGTVSGGASGSGRIVNIHLRVGDLFKASVFHVHDLQADSKAIMGQFGEYLRAELNDVNTLASNFR